jgi:virginiamycin B lyase
MGFVRTHGTRRTFVIGVMVLALAASGCGGTAEAAPTSSGDRGPEASPAVRSTDSSPSLTVEPSTSVPPGPSAASLAERTIAELDPGGGPDLPTAAFDSIWVVAVDGALLDDGTVPSLLRIDPATNEVVASIEIPGRLCQGLGASPEAIWVCGPDGLVRIDPTTNEIVAEVPFEAPLAVSRLAYGAGSMWAFATAAIGPDTVVRVDPATNAVTATIPLGHVAGTMTFGFDALWVTSPTSDSVLRVDPATNTVEVLSSGIEGAGQIAAGEDALWVSLYGEEGAQAPDVAPTIVRIEPSTGDVTAEIDAGTALEDSSGIAVAPDGLWVRGTDPFLLRIDAETAEVVDRIDADLSTGDVTVAYGSVWATSETGAIVRLTPEP